MLVILTIVFIVMPIAELAVIVQVAQGLGIPETIGLLILISVVGAWLCRREGVGVLRRIQTALSKGQLPQRELVDGFLILLAGALLMTPGFLTDVLGIVLLVPPTRAAVRVAVLRSFRRRGVWARIVHVGGTTGGAGPGRRGGDVIDVTELRDP